MHLNLKKTQVYKIKKCYADKFFSKAPEFLLKEKSIKRIREYISRFGEDKIKRFDEWVKIFGV